MTDRSVDAVLEATPPPRYARIAEELALEIAEGRLPAQMKLPSEHALMRIFDVSRVTVRAALELLGKRGLIESRQGAGHFVRRAGGPIRQPNGQLNGFRAQAERHGYRVTTRLLGIEQRKPTSAERLKFGTSPSDMLWSIVRLRLLDTVPALLQTVLLPSDAFAPADRLSVVDDGRGTGETCHDGGLYACLGRRGLRPDRAEDVVDAVALSGDDAARLCLPTGSPVFRFNRVATLPSGRVIEVSQSLVRSDLLKIVLTPGQEAAA